MAAAVGAPDPVRGDIVKAFVVLREGEAPTEALGAALRAHVRERPSPRTNIPARSSSCPSCR